MRRGLTLLALVLTACPNPDDSGQVKESVTPGTDYEAGCILVDGGGGYALLADALTLAEVGSTITLCEGTWEVEVVLEKSVTIEGSSPEAVVLVGPTGATPITFKTGGALRNVTIQSSYNGVEIDAAADVVLENVVFDEVPNRGVLASQAINLVINGCTFRSSGAGGVKVEGGSATIGSSVFEDSKGAAIYGDGATLLIEHNRFDGVEQEARTDGYALVLNDSDTTAADNSFAAAEVGGIYATEGSLTVSGGTFDASPIGIVAENATVDVSGVLIRDASTIGIVVAAQTGLVTLTDVTVQIPPEASCSNDYVDATVDACGGITVIATDGVTLDGVSVRGYENFGVQVWSYDAFFSGGATEVPIAISNVTLDDVGRTGMRLYYVTGPVSNLRVTGLREPELSDDELCAYLDQSVALLGYGGDIQLDVSSFLHNHGWGAVAYVGSMDVTGSTFDSNRCAGVLNVASGVTISASTFSRAALASVLDSEGVTEVAGSTFSDNQAEIFTDVYETTTLNGTLRTETDYSVARDILGSFSQALLVHDNVFERGAVGLEVYGASTLEISGNTWTDYRSTILYTETVSDVVFEQNTLDRVSGPLLLALDTNVSVSEIDVGEMVTVNLPRRHFLNDVLLSSAPVEAVGGGFQIGVYDTTATPRLEISDVVIDVLTGYAVEFYDASVEIDDLVIVDPTGDFASGGVYGYTLYGPLDLDIEGASLGNVAGTGINAASYGGYGGTVSLSEVDMGDVDYYGVSTSDATTLLVDQLTVGSAGYAGVYASNYSGGASYTITDSVVGPTGSLYSGYAGFYLQGDAATLTGNVVSGGLGDGIMFSGGTVVVADNEVFDHDGDGIYFYDAVIDAQNNRFTDNGGYGMVCSVVDFTACMANDLTNNLAGTHSGCLDACGEP